ncbi:MAG: 2-oxoacid:ferredoxin oxidoreductase subunit beta [Gallionellales bacterium RIFCSPLOWO2_02_FULL_59_110]|nr:MAG: 2-oxoacid:ferredoxin oxidoreductase subunit beta [Gallionellales bacterium RIFCSPLOWO2_02_FULL_59_110]
MSTDIEKFKAGSPMSDTLRMDRMPHIWCPGCGIGSEVNSFAEAVKRSGIDPKKLVVVSGIGCTGRVAGYVNFDSMHTTHGRAIPVATGIKLANPELTVVVFSGEGDLAGIGGNHLIHAARRNMDLVVICNNNFTYGMTGGQVTPTTPGTATASTTPYGNYEYPFSLPLLMDAAGATYIARWTSMHSRNVTQSIEEALLRKGFSFIEIISPCPTLYLRRNRLGDGVDQLQNYQDNSILKHGADTRETAIDFQGKIVVGKFVEKNKPTYLEASDKCAIKLVGDDYQLYGKTIPEREAEEKAEKERIAVRRAAVLAAEVAQQEANDAQPAKAAAKQAPAKAVKKAPAKKAAVKAAPKAAQKAPAKTKFQSKVMPAKQALAETKKAAPAKKVAAKPAKKVAVKAPAKKAAPKAKAVAKAPAKKVAPAKKAVAKPAKKAVAKAAPKKTRK